MLLPMVLFAIAAVMALSGAMLVAGESKVVYAMVEPELEQPRKRGARRVYIRIARSGV